jgi:hypothetical protein
MKWLISFILIIVIISPAYSQYLGGNDDGFSLAVSGQWPLNEQEIYCGGGGSDGFSFKSSAKAPLNDQQFYCSGGSDDGFSLLKLENHTLNNQVFYCAGGNGDGSERIGIPGYFFDPALCFSGGANDGFSPLTTGNTHFFNQAFYLSGGINDGFTILNTGPAYICNPSIYLSGGVNDGFAASSQGFSYICDPSVYVSGGMGDGFNNISFAGPIYLSNAWLGGISDGFATLHSPVLGLAPTFFCLGGDNDGTFSLYMPLSYFGPGIWTGTVSSSWNNPANWSLDYVPDLSVNVLIPAGRTYYPLIQSGNLSVNNISGGYFCKSLTISEGGSLINKSNLYLYGDMTVSGIYQGDGNNWNDVFINPGGNLKILAPGIMQVGN